MQFFDPNNAFDAEGLTRLTEQTQRRARERNEIERDTAVAISRKNFEATQLQLEIDRNKRFAELAQIAGSVGARSRAGVRRSRRSAPRRSAKPSRRRSTAQRQIREAEVAQATRPCASAQAEAEREVSIAQVEQQRATQIAEQSKAISIAQKSEEQSQAEARPMRPAPKP